MPHKHIELSKIGFQGRPHEDHGHVKFHRLNETVPTDQSHHLATAIGEVHVGEPIPTQYPGPAVGYIIEGEIHVEDKSKPNEITKLVAGDVIHFDQDTSLTFSTPNSAKVFGVSYVPSPLNFDDFVLKK